MTLFCIREHIPLEQGLRQALNKIKVIVVFIREHIPLEQGLRLSSVSFLTDDASYQRAYSIRTRIKTEYRTLLGPQATIREHIPLEQGLRQWLFLLLVSAIVKIREHIPLEQGLRPVSFNSFRSVSIYQRAYSIRTRIKTSQPWSISNNSETIREHIPLEQGLRPLTLFIGTPRTFDQRAYSIRTRIKTLWI